MAGPTDEFRGQQLMDEASARLREGVARLASGWIEQTTMRIVDAWDRLDPEARAAVMREARDAGHAGTHRVVDELDVLFATDVARQRSTPLEIVRSLRREVTSVLIAAGIPGVVRDQFEERAFPDDTYGVVPRSLGELGDEELGPQLIAWGLGKSMVLRARAERGDTGLF